MRACLRLGLSAWLACVCGLLSSRALAQDASVVVLGLRSVEGDDDVATTITDALRAAAGTVEGWEVQPRGPTMAQMSMAHGCDEMDAQCLSDIADGLSVQQVVYGTVRRTSTRAAFDYVLSLSLFNAEAGAIENSLSETIPRSVVDGGTVSSQAADLIAGLTGQQTSQALGALRVSLNVAAAARFYVDGSLAGESRSGGFAQEGVAAGVHGLRVEAEGFHDFETTFEVAAGSPTQVAVNLLPSQPVGEPPAAFHTEFDDSEFNNRPSGVRRWLPYALLGTSAASLIGMGASWAVIDSVNNDEDFKAYSNAVYIGNQSRTGTPAVQDVCDEALSGSPYPQSGANLSDIQDMCKRGRTFEVLQWVFLGSAVLSGGAGAYLLVTEDSDDGQARRRGPSLSLRPRVGLGEARLDAKLTF